MWIAGRPSSAISASRTNRQPTEDACAAPRYYKSLSNLSEVFMRRIPAHRGRQRLESFSTKTGSAGALAIGALAVGALAIGALAIGTLAIKRMAIRHARIQSLTIDELTVHRLRHIGSNDEPTSD